MKKIFIVILIFFVTGCSTLQEVSNSEGRGISKTFDYTYKDVWSASVKVVAESELIVVESNESAGKILAEKGWSAFSYGEKVGVFVRKETESKTKVEVVSKRALKVNITAKDWSTYILNRISAVLM